MAELEHEWRFKYDTLAQDKWICRSVDFCVRTQKIPFRHYEVTAWLDKNG